MLDQGDGDWTTRQRRLLRGAPARGEGRIVLTSTDSPQLRPDTVAAAFGMLDRHDLVLGPVADGGYYLIGMRGFHDVLDGVVMSTGTVFGDIAARARTLGLSVGTTEELFDVDVGSELEPLRALLEERDDLPHTRSALERHGLLGAVAARA